MINIAITENKYFVPLYNNKEYIEKNNIRLLPMKEEEALEMLINSRIDLALISPFAYGSAVGKCDLRILNTKLCMAENYTNTVSIFFKNGLTEIKTATFPKSDTYTTNISQILLKEKYDLFLDSKFEDDSPYNFESDLLVSWQDDRDYQNKINLTEEWFDNFFNPLPLALWVCKAEDSPDNLKEITNNLFKNDNLIDDFYIEVPFKNDSYIQEGKVYWEWDNEFKNVIENTLQVMYFHQLLPELPEIKFYEGQ